MYIHTRTYNEFFVIYIGSFDTPSEVMIIMILFHGSGYRCLKHFYLQHVCKHLRHLFPKVVSYNRFVELEYEMAIPLAIFRDIQFISTLYFLKTAKIRLSSEKIGHGG